MLSDELVLSFDTSAAHCAAALLLKDQLLGVICEDMQKGQAESLGPMVLNLLEKNNVHLSDITRIGVGIGPGNFTGIRIAVSFARGLGLALQRPVFGIDSFEATYLGHQDAAVVTVPAPRNDMYFQPFPRTKTAPQIAPLDEILKNGSKVIKRSATSLLVENIARLAAKSDPDTAKPAAPLYIKPADAAPPRDNGPKVLP